MNSIDAFQKRLRDEIATVEKEIESHNQQIEALNKRLEGLKRAAELFESEQAAIVELLQTGTANGSGIPREMPTAPAATCREATTSPKAPVRTTSSGVILRLAAARRRAGPTGRSHCEPTTAAHAR